MAVFTNYATLSYNGLTAVSNTVTGEILETITVTHTPTPAEYSLNGDVTFIVSLLNSGAADVTGLTVTCDLGAFEEGGADVYPLSYVGGSLRCFVGGVPTSGPSVSSAAPLTVTDVSVPAGAGTLLVYEAEVTGFAPPAAGGMITNTATVTGSVIAEALTAEAVITACGSAELMIAKSVSPAVVAAGGRLTYTFDIENVGNTATQPGDSVVLSDVFAPVLSDLAVACDGTSWTAGAQYSYDASTGAFTTLAGAIAVPAATYTRNPDGSWSVEPGSIVVTVTGTLPA